ncbi:cytoskeletal protein CcmA (bactofilin family) [Povalibacter uvarum]|uniref:Cytoskeletal protein CcmA (Bactofilin family) n=1 Tax=Povalibacter uvarum TaxID=732238 RepID=A0A841HMF2_9GAMM|nr:polymer-forming cytoskeletal protein [Povalibacter uvarum]MBB6093529.1 cytoskeletal protein CcmA (bactofilin family) [Povalibacter uvarum]
MRNLILDTRADNEATRIQPQPSFAVPPPRQSEQKAIAVLGPTLRFKGELSAEEDFILQGQLEGSINHTQSVTIGTDGSVVGNIHARHITIDGKVEGDLHATEAVVVHATGELTGNIFAPKVGIVEGAFFNGRVEMGEARASGRRPNARPGVPLSSEETERMLSEGD